MERVTGIGGFFFQADDPDALSRWYAEHLGVGFPPEADEDDEWFQEAGPTVFAPFGRQHWESPHLDGRFANLHDPEGNAVQLWEPA